MERVAASEERHRGGGGDEAQDEAWRAFERSRWKIAGGAGLFFLAASSAAVALFGRRYPFHPAWLLLFASAASLVLTHGVYSALYSARSFRGLGVSVAGSLLAGAVNAGAAWLLIPRLGITGAALALLCGFGCSLAFYVLIGYRRRP